MANDRNRFDLTSADTKIIGFEYQYFYFINELLKLTVGQSIGFEVKDDVHIELPWDRKVIIKLVQLKHTVQKNAKNEPINLTDKDDDLWKSLSNWCKVICDKNASRESEKAQLKFITETEFIFATNKNISKNQFINNVNKKMNCKQIKKYLDDVIKDTNDSNVKNHILDITNLNEKVLNAFISKISFIDTGDKIIEEIKLNIRRKMISENRINDVFNNVYSELKQDFFKKVEEKGHQILTFDEWIKKYTCIFENNRTTYLNVRSLNPPLPDDLFKQPFIKQLIEIGDIKKNNLPDVTDLTESMLNAKMNLKQWCIDGEITNTDVKRFEEESIFIWKNIHKRSHRSTKFDIKNDNTNALKCLDDIREKELTMHNTSLGLYFSNGEFYYLSNHEQIGWKIEWERNY